MAPSDPAARAAGLSCWTGPLSPEPLLGGITNRNFVVSDGGRRFVVRIGEDIPLHHVLRFNELAASRAAAKAGISPGVFHSEPGAVVFEFIEGRTLSAEDVRKPEMLARIVALIRSCHRDVAEYLRGPVLAFPVFHVLSDYRASLEERASPWLGKLPPLFNAAHRLRTLSGPGEMVFSHNDLLAANLIDDGKRLWLIDWDYAGFNDSLFDLGNLCSNNEVARPEEEWLLEAYFERPVEGDLWRRYQAMKCASLLREALWAMVSESASGLGFDYAQYARTQLARFARAYSELE